MQNTKETTCRFCKGEKIKDHEDANAVREEWRLHQYHNALTHKEEKEHDKYDCEECRENMRVIDKEGKE